MQGEESSELGMRLWRRGETGEEECEARCGALGKEHVLSWVQRGECRAGRGGISGESASLGAGEESLRLGSGTGRKSSGTAP